MMEWANCFWGIKNTSFCCFMAAIKFFRRLIGECCLLRDKIKGRNYINRIQLTNQGAHNKNIWLVSFSKCVKLCDKIVWTSLELKEIKPIRDRFINHHSAWPYSVCFPKLLPKIFQTNCPYTGQQTLEHLKLFLDYVRGQKPNWIPVSIQVNRFSFTNMCIVNLDHV